MEQEEVNYVMWIYLPMSHPLSLVMPSRSAITYQMHANQWATNEKLNISKMRIIAVYREYRSIFWSNRAKRRSLVSFTKWMWNACEKEVIFSGFLGNFLHGFLGFFLTTLGIIIFQKGFGVSSGVVLGFYFLLLLVLRCLVPLSMRKLSSHLHFEFSFHWVFKEIFKLLTLRGFELSRSFHGFWKNILMC